MGWADRFPDWLTSTTTLLSAVGVVVVAVAAALHAVLSRREVRSSIGWVGLILMVPFLGAILYAVFGVNRIQRAAVQIRAESRRPRDPLTPGVNTAPDSTVVRHFAERPGLSDIAEIVGEVTGRTLLVGNRVEPLRHGDEAYPAMIDAIAGAEQSVTLCTYIFDNDWAGHRFVDALENAARRGVEVRVLVDAAGARYSWPRIDRVLKRRGVRVERFLPMALTRLRYFNLRNHRKVLVVDGATGFTGGINIRLGHWLERKPARPVQDIHFKLEGPIVSQLQEVFAEDWHFASGEWLEGERWFPALEHSGPTLARGIPDGPDADFDALNWTINAAITSAESRIRIATPYFLPDPIHAHALKLAALRGVDVDIVLPSKSNLPYMDWAMWGQFWTVLDHGVRLWQSPPPFDHSKLMVVDDYWTLFGSSNWDPRSLRLNFEFNVETYCDQLGPVMNQVIEEQIAKSQRVTRVDLDQRPLHLRIRDSIAGLASPYL